MATGVIIITGSKSSRSMQSSCGWRSGTSRSGYTAHLDSSAPKRLRLTGEPGNTMSMSTGTGGFSISCHGWGGVNSVSAGGIDTSNSGSMSSRTTVSVRRRLAIKAGSIPDAELSFDGSEE